MDNTLSSDILLFDAKTRQAKKIASAPITFSNETAQTYMDGNGVIVSFIEEQNDADFNLQVIRFSRHTLRFEILAERLN